MRTILLLLLAVLSPAPASAQDFDPMEVMEPVPGFAREEARVVLTPDGDELFVTIALSQAVDALHLLDAGALRMGAVQVLTEGIRLEGNTLASDTPVSELRFRLSEVPAEFEFAYQPYYSVGEGRMLFAPALYPDPRNWRVSLAVEGAPDGWTRWPERDFPRGYVFIGPDNMIAEAHGMRFVRDPAIDDGFDPFVGEAARMSMDWLSEKLGDADEYVISSPFFVASTHPEQPRPLLANVSADGMVAVRFGDTSFDPTAPDALPYARSLILHEGVHFWQSGIVNVAPGTPVWFHEGGAEYLGLVGALELGWLDEEQVAIRLSEWLGECRNALSRRGEAALGTIDAFDWAMRYDCGAILQFLAELYAAEGGGGPTVLEGWRNTLRFADMRNEGFYDRKIFAQAMDMPDLWGRPAIAAIVNGTGPARWDTVEAEMRRLGVETGERTSPILRARSVLMPLLTEHCTQMKPGEQYGFYWGGPTFVLDTPKGCGELAGSPEVTTLAGHPVTALDAEGYAEIQAICDRGGAIVFGTVEGRDRHVPCTLPIGDPLTEPGILAVPDIRAFSE